MKVLYRGFLSLSLLALLVACGKENKSGQNSWSYGNPYGVNPIAINSQSHVANSIMGEYPCMNQGGYPGGGYPQTSHRIPISVPLAGFQHSVPMAPGEAYVGVSSFGDVAVVIGTAIGQPPIFHGYICPRSFAPQGQGQLMGVKLGLHSRCKAKPITAATVLLPGGGTVEFRMPDFGRPNPMNPMGQPIPFQICL